MPTKCVVFILDTRVFEQTVPGSPGRRALQRRVYDRRKFIPLVYDLGEQAQVEQWRHSDDAPAQQGLRGGRPVL